MYGPVSKKLIKTLSILEKLEKEKANTLLLEKNNLEQMCLFLEKEKDLTHEYRIKERSLEADTIAFTTFPAFENALIDKIMDINRTMDDTSHQLLYIQEDLRETYRTLKTWEVLRKQLQEKENQDNLKKEQAILDEVGQKSGEKSSKII